MPDGLCGMHIVAADMIEMLVAESFIVCSTHRYLSPVAWGAWGAEVSFPSSPSHSVELLGHIWNSQSRKGAGQCWHGMLSATMYCDVSYVYR